VSIVRVRRQSGFTVIPNEIINDDALDGATLGLLVYLLSKPSDWSVSIKSLATLKRFGSHEKIVSGLKLLRALGYAQLRKFRDGSTDWTITDDKGRFMPYSEIPNKANDPNSEIPNKASQGVETHGTPDLMPDSENPNKAGTPDLMPDSENPNALQRTELNKKLKSKRARKESNETGRPEDFTITDELRAWYAKRGYTPRLEDYFEHFVEADEAKPHQYANWYSALKIWIRKDYAGLRQAQGPPKFRQSPAEPKSRSKHTILA
jgi:hypothetical protein